MKKIVAGCIMVILLAAPVGVADVFQPSPICSAPYKPCQFNSQYEYENYMRQARDYRACLERFISEQYDASKRHSDAAQDAISVRVKQEGATRAFNAETLFVQPQVDLAVLRVTNAKFNGANASIPVGDRPQLELAVQAFGYPEGGETLSITTGVVSRMEYAKVAHNLEWHLLLQTDAAINGGNSGGPLVADGKLVGINAQGLDKAENIACAISAPVIRQFLHDIDDGVVDGRPSVGVLSARLENPARMRPLGHPQDIEGEAVLTTIEGSGSHGVLRCGDVLTHVDGYPIERDGRIAGSNGLRIDCKCALVEKQLGATVTLEFLHQGQKKSSSLRGEHLTSLVASGGSEERSGCFGFGGALFQPLTTDYLLLFEEGGMSLNMRVRLCDEHQRAAGQLQIAILNRVLAHDINRGYQDLADVIVTAVDGQAVRDLDDFADKVSRGSEEFVTIDFLTHEQMVFSRREVLEAEDSVAEIHGIHSSARFPGAVR